MKYVAFRIDTSTIKDHKVVDGYFVRGQKTTTGPCWPSVTAWTPQRSISNPSVPTPSGSLFTALAVTVSTFNYEPAPEVTRAERT